mmetsp:Transcript_3975/g.6035  ORF Transcript_3975/g.6035 Transcript_3975/m.6035 type:complete len:624 (+) Transcript_3975:1127-2998(+)
MKEHLDVLGPAFARDTHYIRILIFSAAFQGTLLGFVASAFSLSVQKLAEATWYSGEYLQAIEFGKSFDFTIRAVENEINKTTNNSTFLKEDDVSIDSLLLGNGEWWYIWLLALAGFGVGLVKVIWNLLGSVVPNVCKQRFPARFPGFIEEVCDLENHDTIMAIPFFIVSALSGGLGACVGPEAALLYIGSSVGTLVSRRWQLGTIKARKISGSGGQSFRNNDNSGENENNPGSNSSSAIDISDQQADQQSEVEELNDDNLFICFVSNLLPDFSDRRAECCLEGIAAAVGGLFPAQFLSPLVVHEVGNHWHWGVKGRFHVTETVATTGVSATFSYAIMQWLRGGTLIQSFKVPNIIGQSLQDFEVRFLGYGVLVGFVSGLIGFAGFLIFICGVRLGQKVFMRMKMFFMKRVGLAEAVSHNIVTVVNPVIGGTLLGLLYVAVPLCLGGGLPQLYAVMTLGNRLGACTVAVTAFTKLLCLGISQGFGFIGGPLFPIIFAGACTGSLIHIIFPGIPVIISFASGFAATPVAIIPGIFTVTALSSVMFLLGGAASSAVFIACVMSYITVCGMGLMQGFILKGMKAAEAARSGGRDRSESELDPSSRTVVINPLLEKTQEGEISVSTTG